MTSQEEATVEKIFVVVGDNGTYQKLLYWFFLVPINIIIPWTALVPLFQVSLPDHWCYVPGQPDGVSLEGWKNMTIPREDDGPFSKCKQYSDILSTIGTDYFVGSASRNVTACQTGWSYDHAWYDQTLSMAQNWVCHRQVSAARWLAAGVAGNVVGTLLFNTMSDYCGRKITLIITTQVYALFAISRLFVTSEFGLLILMFISSLPFPAILQISYILVLEQVSQDLRALITSVACIMWTIGMCTVPLLAWLSRDWVLLGIVTSLPFIPFIVVWWALPESPRWLVSNGRIEAAEKSFDKISKINLRESPPDLHSTLKSVVDAQTSQKKSTLSYLNFIDLFSHPVLRKRTLILVTVYTCNYLIYYILIYNAAVNIGGNEFVNFFYLAITELPSNIVGWICSQYFGRRFTGVAFFFLATLLAGVAVFLHSSSTWVLIGITVTSKAFITVSFFVIYIQLAEIYPTSHRGTGIGVSSIVSLLIGISGPYIAYTGAYWPSLPYVILVFIGMLGTVSALFIPETMGESLPETISDAENFLVKRPFWSYVGWRPKKGNSQEADGVSK